MRGSSPAVDESAAAATATGEGANAPSAEAPTSNLMAMKRSFQQARTLSKTIGIIPAGNATEGSDTEKTLSTSQVPPPVVATQRPLRRRLGPEWACVEVLCENDEKGPCESTVRCRFCGHEFLADTARIREHVETYHPPDDDIGVDATFSYGQNGETPDAAAPSPALGGRESPRSPAAEGAPSGSARRSPSVGVRPSSAASTLISNAPRASPHPDADPNAPPPLPPCSADLGPHSKEDRQTALQWFQDYDLLQFCNRVGVAVTPAVAKARRYAEVAEARAILYPGKEHADDGAARAREAVDVVTRATTTEWLTVSKLRFLGCGLKDDDCFKLVDMLDKAGSLRELREFSLAQNFITDVGFEAICEHVIAPEGSYPRRTSIAKWIGSEEVERTTRLGENKNREQRPSHDEGSQYSSLASRDGAYEDMEDMSEYDIKPSLLGYRLTEFSVFRNPIGDRGVKALAAALEKGGLPNLRSLNISGTALINPDGSPRNITAHERARAGAAATDEYGIRNHGIGDAGIKEFAIRLKRCDTTPGRLGMLTFLRDLRLFGNSIGDDGLIALATAFSERSALCRVIENLWLQNNFIGDKGLCFMVETLFNGGMVNLHRLLLADNCIGAAGGEAVASALGRGALAKLYKLSLGGNNLGEESITRLSSCLVERTHSLGGKSVVEIDLIPATPELDLSPDSLRRSFNESTMLSSSRQSISKTPGSALLASRTSSRYPSKTSMSAHASPG